MKGRKKGKFKGREGKKVKIKRMRGERGKAVARRERVEQRDVKERRR